jgi:hypothetical protein
MQEESRIRQIKAKVELNSETLERLVENIVIKYNRELNEEIEKVKELLSNKDNLNDSEVENLVMRIPVFMYYASGGLESLGVESDMAKAVKSEVFNEKYMLAEGTIKDKEAQATNQTFNEQMIEVAFARAYKKLKVQLEMAEHVFSGAKKVLSKRMQDIDISKRDS